MSNNNSIIYHNIYYNSMELTKEIEQCSKKDVTLYSSTSGNNSIEERKILGKLNSYFKCISCPKENDLKFCKYCQKEERFVLSLLQ